MKKRNDNINFKINPIEKELFNWFAGFQGTDTSKRIKSLIAPDIDRAKRTLRELDTTDNEYLTELKRQIEE